MGLLQVFVLFLGHYFGVENGSRSGISGRVNGYIYILPAIVKALSKQHFKN